MSAWYSKAVRRPVAYIGLHDRQPRRAVIGHTNGGGTDHGSLFGWWSSNASGARGKDNRHVGAHLQVMLDGRVEQYVPFTKVVYHAYAASEWAIGIEVEDDGHPEHPMTDAQVDVILDICRELAVPARLLTSPDPGDGVGWHEQYPAWNQEGHNCPGSVREQQIHAVILPALAGPAPQPFPAWYRPGHPLRRGVIGWRVLGLKRHLRALGYKGITWASPIYGPGVDHAVRAFQRRSALTIDGVVGDRTARALRRAR